MSARITGYQDRGRSYVKFDDKCDEHPKVAAVGDAQFRAWFGSILYCGRNLTDGFVPTGVVVQRWWKHRAALVAAGLWEISPGGIVVHDYLEWNDSRAVVEARREQARTAGRASGRTRRSSASSTDRSTDSSTDAQLSVEPEANGQLNPSSYSVSTLQELPAGPGVSSNITPDQTYLVRKLQERGEGWNGLAWSGIGKLNNDFGKQTVTEALRRMAEELTVPAASFPLLRSVCQSLATREAARGQTVKTKDS